MKKIIQKNVLFLFILFCTWFNFSLLAQVDFDKDLVGYWPFNSSGINQSPNLVV